MRRLGLVLGLVLWAGPGLAQDGVACLQEQLTALEVYDGPTDGIMRPAVRDAARNLTTSRPLPELRARTAMSWCRQIGKDMAELQRHWPSTAAPVIGSGTDPAKALLSQSFSFVQTYFRDTHDIALATRIAIIGGGPTLDFDATLTAALSELDRRPRRAPVNTDRLCRGPKIGGAANRGYMLFCWPEAPEGAAWAAQTRPALLPIMVHEYTHQIQYALAADDPAQRVDGAWRLGPHWMVEGVAELIEWQFEAGTDLTDGAALFDLQSHARRERATLTDLSGQGTVDDSRAYGTARFAAYLLAQRHGTGALFDYFRALGRGLDQEAAFVDTFGLTPAAYDALFEGLRRDYGAARRFGRDGDRP